MTCASSFQCSDMKATYLILPTEEGFQVRRYNDRYSANKPGVTYTFEAYR